MRPILVLAMVLVLAVAGCAPAATPSAAPGAPASAALRITGAVAKPLALDLAALKALPAAQIKAEHPKKGMQDYAGVRFSTLLAQAQPNSSAKTLAMTASDGFVGEIGLADLAKCADCMLAFNGSDLDAAMPGQASGTWVRSVVKIEIK